MTRRRVQPTTHGRFGVPGLPVVAAVVAAAVAPATVASSQGNTRARGAAEAVVGLVVLAALRSALTAGAGDRRGFWRLIAGGLGFAAVSYAAGALRWLGAPGPWPAVDATAIAAAYPFLAGALCVRAVREEGFEGGLATLLDVVVIIAALLAAVGPTALLPLLDHADADRAVATGAAIADVALMSGGIWLLYRLPRQRDPRGVACLVAAVAVFTACELTKAELLLHRGGEIPWPLSAAPLAGYLLVALAPSFDRLRPAPAPQVTGDSSQLRLLLPYATLAPLGALYAGTVVVGGDTRRLGTAMVIVAVLILARQLLLLRDHRRLLVRERRRVTELSLLHDAARSLSANVDLDAALATICATAADIAIPDGATRGRAHIARLDGAVATIVAIDAPGSAPVVGTSFPVAGVVAEVVQSGQPAWQPIVPAQTPESLRDAVRGSLSRSVLLAPISVGGSVWGVVGVAMQQPTAADAETHRRLQSVATLAGLAVGNALAYRALATAATQDPLTGVLNRREFDRILGTLPREGFAILAIDVDDLKRINDEYGHEAGDEVLRAVAHTLSGLVRSGDVLARTGGDEFCILLHGAGPVDAAAAGERMRRALHGVNVPWGRARISVGYAAGRQRDDPADVLRAADAALYTAKRTGRDRVAGAVGNADGAEMVRVLAGELVERIVDSGSMDSVFQVIRSIDGAEVVGYEALARPPGAASGTSVEEIFAAALRMGALRDLDWLSRRAAMERARDLPTGLPVFINATSAFLLDPVHDVDQMLLLCRWTGRDPSDVVLEITERETIADTERLRLVVAAYREHGFRFAVDDVGEGHSTLEVLAAAVPDFVKIARSLCVTSHHAGSAAAIRAAVAFARSTGARVIAEGVETAEQARVLADMGVDLAQGWWFGRPGAAPAADVELAVG